MDRNDRSILILGILVLVLLALGYYFLLFSPVRQEYLARYDELTQKEAQEAQLEQTVVQLENGRRNAHNIERQTSNTPNASPRRTRSLPSWFK